MSSDTRISSALTAKVASTGPIENPVQNPLFGVSGQDSFSRMLDRQVQRRDEPRTAPASARQEQLQARRQEQKAENRRADGKRLPPDKKPVQRPEPTAQERTSDSRRPAKTGSASAEKNPQPVTDASAITDASAVTQQEAANPPPDQAVVQAATSSTGSANPESGTIPVTNQETAEDASLLAQLAAMQAQTTAENAMNQADGAEEVDGVEGIEGTEGAVASGSGRSDQENVILPADATEADLALLAQMAGQPNPNAANPVSVTATAGSGVIPADGIAITTDNLAPTDPLMEAASAEPVEQSVQPVMSTMNGAQATQQSMQQTWQGQAAPQEQNGGNGDNPESTATAKLNQQAAMSGMPLQQDSAQQNPAQKTLSEAGVVADPVPQADPGDAGKDADKQAEKGQEFSRQMQNMVERNNPLKEQLAALAQQFKGNGDSQSKPDSHKSDATSDIKPVVVGRALEQLGNARVDAARPLSTGIQTLVGQKEWAGELGQRLVMMVSSKLKSAEIHLNPKDLGPMEVRIRMHEDRAHVVFTSQVAQTREALEQAVPRLREMLDQQGVALGNVDVQDQGARHSHQQEQLAERRDGSAGTKSGAGSPADESVVTTIRRPLGLVDYYA